jgi:hypothetical protein
MKCYGPHSSHYKHDYKKKVAEAGTRTRILSITTQHANH